LTRKIESKVYDSKGVLVKYNGQYLDGTRYKSDIIVQNSNNSTVVEAANALFKPYWLSALSVGLSLSKLQPTRLVRPIVDVIGFKP
jgi:hypothetical protein